MDEKESSNPIDLTETQPFILARCIDEVSASFKRLLTSGLSERAIVALVADDTKLTKRDIKTVLDSLKTLSETYTSLNDMPQQAQTNAYFGDVKIGRR